VTVINMCCRAGMKTLQANSVDSVVTDAPYGLSKQPKIEEVLKHWLAGDDYTATGGGFMGKTWDSFVPGPLTWAEAYRILKPGGYCVVFAGSRTVDLMAMSLRIAGFEVVDMLHWLYGSGFPKSLDIGKATGDPKWEGFGTALKPAHEPIILCRKPLDGTYANNVLKHGAGALNIDGCRVGTEKRTNAAAGNKAGGASLNMSAQGMPENVEGREVVGRWPGNVLHDGCLPDPMGRYFYSAKATKADREAGLELFKLHTAGEVTGGRGEGSAGLNSPRSGAGRTRGAKNIHPTVKPTELMRWLCRLVTPPGGLIVDPFTGSGSTGRGAALEGFEFLGFELDAQYSEIARARIEDAKK